jgi:hypothetical protein
MFITGFHPTVASTHEQESSWTESVASNRTELDHGNIDAVVAALSSAMIKHGEQIWMFVAGHDMYRTAARSSRHLYM